MHIFFKNIAFFNFYFAKNGAEKNFRKAPRGYFTSGRLPHEVV